LPRAINPFANEAAVRMFETEFRAYMVPELLDGPELAPEVAKLERMSGEWADMDYRGIVDYMSGDGKVVREVREWRLHNPIAERETEMHMIGAESLSDEVVIQGEPDESAPVIDFDI
jgi:hypothetical protein